MAEPAPLITITDPLNPAPVQDLVGREPDPHWAWPVRALALAIVLLLAVGFARATDLRQSRRLQQRADRTSVVARVDGSSPTRLSGLDRMAITLVLLSSDRADLLRVTGSGGWVPTGGQDLPLLPGTEARLELEHPFDCLASVAGPTTVRARLRVEGAKERDVALALPTTPATTQIQAFACGDLDGRDAVRLVASQVLRHDGRSTVTAQLSNISTHDLTISQVAFAGFSFRPTRPLPLALPGRAPGLLVEEEVPTRALVLDALVADCRTARAALDSAKRSGFPDALTFLGQGAGGAFRIDRSVAGVEVYLEAEWSSTCGR